MIRRIMFIVIPIVVVAALATINTGSADFVCPVLPVSQNAVANTDGVFITIFDGDGEFLGKWGEQGGAPGQVDGPSGLAFDSRDNLYVVDHKNSRIQKFTTSGDYLSGWGEAGGGPGQFNMPWGLTVGPARRHPLPAFGGRSRASLLNSRISPYLRLENGP